jgi:hypothetical protein
MKMVTMGFPKTVFPFRSVSQRLTLEYDEIDEIMDELFSDIFDKIPENAPVMVDDEAPLQKKRAG